VKNLTILLLPLLILSSTAIVQTVDEILEENYAVIELDKLLQMNTFSTKGKIIHGQFENPFTSNHKRPKA